MAAGRADPVSTDALPVDEPIGVYVHWPFCLSKCPYCDFNSHVAAAVDHDRWRAALVRDLEGQAARIGRRRVESVFFGGGTPSLMAPETVAAVLAAVGRLFRLSNDLEVTLEANPTSVEAGKLEAFRDAGVNRVSLGVQALDDAVLKFLGRAHSAEEALAAVATARERFERVSFDLIYARPDQSPESWRRELTDALRHAAGHLSLYQLTIEPTTPFHSLHARGAFRLPDEDAAAALWDVTQETLEAAGLPAYEVSNHARPGQECRHNLVYWSYRDYLGVGPGAHGRLTERGRKVATRAHRAPALWLERVEREGHALVDDRPLARDETLVEATLTGLRLAGGVPRERWHALFGTGPETLFEPATIELLTGGGFLELDAEGLRATAAGRTRLDAVTDRLLRGVTPAG
ncbi:coproporphyrinogen III oxidase [Thalassobaculum fulvum]|uniref:Heme chaperone HemW n=1 Tax=Thalassobaculum fulvum TaxID=1633335 RepID=A0A918XNI0_9PROT|nr:radical SAM family heme chaperone HemW [Thalassobaculum fulvum]GHD39757.1 coproporphyrinogen III oxidase [Thalassobaculum fulvum]